MRSVPFRPAGVATVIANRRGAGQAAVTKLQGRQRRNCSQHCDYTAGWDSHRYQPGRGGFPEERGESRVQSEPGYRSVTTNCKLTGKPKSELSCSVGRNILCNNCAAVYEMSAASFCDCHAAQCSGGPCNNVSLSPSSPD